MTTATRTYRLTDASPDNLPLDLREEFALNPSASIFGVVIYDYDGITQAPEMAWGLYNPQDGRMGIAWGAEATWADVQDVDQGVEMWLNDGDSWQLAN